MNKIAFYYFGGCGGFFAFWHLIIGTDFNCHFHEYKTLKQIRLDYELIKGVDWPDNLDDATEDNVDKDFWNQVKSLKKCNILYDTKYLTEIYNDHWNISQKDKWKSSEVSPVNELTEKLYNKKLLLFCNPTIEQWNKHKDGYRILLYTDLSLHLLLSKNKKAGLYHNKHKDKDQIEKIYKESVMLNGTRVFGPIGNLTNGDLYIKLQDCVKTSGEALLKPLGYKVLEKNIEHNRKWLSLHDNEEYFLLKS
jgi:hypothetical protein